MAEYSLFEYRINYSNRPYENVLLLRLSFTYNKEENNEPLEQFQKVESSQKS